MSIRLRFTLLYSVILALTLAVFGIALYTIQARTTMNALKQDLMRSSEALGNSLARASLALLAPNAIIPPRDFQPPTPFQDFSGDPEFRNLREREVARILSPSGSLLASPMGQETDALPLSDAGLATVQGLNDCWETGQYEGQSMLILNRPVLSNGELAFILQVARPLTERNRSLQALGITFGATSLVLVLIAFGIGWLFSGITLRPIQRITHTARRIGAERDFTRRVDYHGPPDEVGQLATTFNAMLGRLEEAYQRVAHSLEMQRNFVADVSHELRTPLTTLRGNLGLLGRTPPIPADEAADVLNDMVDESDRLIRLVNDLLVLARADAGRSLAREPFEVVPVLEETLRQVQPIDPERPITLDVPAGLQVLGDRDAFKQVTLILLDNALKHSDGSIRLTARPAEGRVQVQVHDSGPGIPPEVLEHIFDRFYRGGNSPSGTGFGLGLAIARALVEGMGGSIVMQSQPGQGSTVSLHLDG